MRFRPPHHPLVSKLAATLTPQTPLFAYVILIGIFTDIVKSLYLFHSNINTFFNGLVHILGFGQIYEAWVRSPELHVQNLVLYLVKLF